MKDKILACLVFALVGCGSAMETIPESPDFDICREFYDGKLRSFKRLPGFPDPGELSDIVQKYCENKQYQDQGQGENVDPEPF